MSANNFKAYIVRRFPDGEPAGDDEFRIICPRCQNPDQKAFINLKTGKSDCKQCTYFRSAGWWTTIALIEGLGNAATAQDWFEKQRGFAEYTYTAHHRTGEVRTPMVRALPKEFNLIKRGDQSAHRYLTYLVGRGFNMQLIERFGMGYCETGKYGNRVIVPVSNDEGLEFFFDRLIVKDDEVPKTLGIGGGTYYWPVKKKTVIFNYANCQDLESINVAEGIFSALSINPNNTVALLGKECSGVQLFRLINTKAREFHLYLDPDAKPKIFSLAYKLHSYGREVYIHWLNPTVGDPNDYLLKGKVLPVADKWSIVHEIDGLKHGWIVRKK